MNWSLAALGDADGILQSLRGISHNPIEDTKIEHIEMSVRALDKLADKAMAWITQ